MKILVVSYLPSLQNSRTKKLLDTFLESVKDKSNVEILDLLKDTPNFITAEVLQAYVHRNYMGQALTQEEQKSVEQMDRYLKQFKAADLVVLATPMHNFSLPGMVKAYIDLIIIKGETFDKGGLMQGKKALILNSSGLSYEGEYAKNDHATTLAKLAFDFMGFSDVKIVRAQGLDKKNADVAKIVLDAQEQVKEVVKEWGL